MDQYSQDFLFISSIDEAVRREGVTDEEYAFIFAKLIELGMISKEDLDNYPGGQMKWLLRWWKAREAGERKT